MLIGMLAELQSKNLAHLHIFVYIWHYFLGTMITLARRCITPVTFRGSGITACEHESPHATLRAGGLTPHAGRLGGAAHGNHYRGARGRDGAAPAA